MTGLPQQEASYPPELRATVQPLGCSLEAYCASKALPEDLVRAFGVREVSRQGLPVLRIPYQDSIGEERAVRFRTAVQKGENSDTRFSWKRGSRTLLYGLWRLRAESSVIVVEGESDCHTLWLYGINAVGLPGATTWNEQRDAPVLAAFEYIHVLVEPDAGGVAMAGWVQRSSLRDKISFVRLPGFKDPSAMHIDDPTRFRERWDGAIAASVPWRDEEARRAGQARQEAFAACAPLASDPDILSRFALEMRRAGVVGVEREAKLLYLAVTSRLLPRPVSVAIKGPSAAGKNFLVSSVLSFFPQLAYYAMTAMSDRVLAYSDEPLQNRILVVYEADGMQGETCAYLLRSLLSEGEIRYETVQKTPQGLTARLLERKGPTGLIVTTTRLGLHPENETRLLSLTLSDSEEQTRAIMMALAREDEREDADRTQWHRLHEWIASSPVVVVVPFAEALLAAIPPVAVRLRRDTRLLLDLVRTHALLHQANRECDERGRIVATIEDYAAIHALVSDLLAEGLGATVSEAVRETVRTVGVIEGRDKTATVARVAEALNIDKSAASRRCAAARKGGYIKNEEPSKGRPARYVLADPLPDERAILPDPDALRNPCEALSDPSGCTVAVESRDSTPISLADGHTDERRRIVL